MDWLMHNKRRITMSFTLFEDTTGQILSIIRNKSNIVLDAPDAPILPGNNINQLKFTFTPDIFHDIIETLTTDASHIWKNFTPRVAESLGSDYDEYYDRKLDNNGYLSISVTHHSITCTRPLDTSSKLYQLNKRKTESLLYDLTK